MTPARPMPTPPSARQAVGFALVVTALAWIGVSFSHLPGAWGLDTLRHAPSVLGLAALALLALALVPSVAHPVRAMVGALGDALAAHGALPYTIVGAMVFALLLAPRDPLHFVGDSGLRLAAITVRGDTGTVFPQAALLDRVINLHLARALADALPIEGADALQVVGAALGAMWAAAALALLRALGLHGAPLGAALLVALLSGIPLHFAGYDKFGPLTLAMALACVGAVRAMQGARPWLFALGLIAALLSHRTGLLVLPGATVVVAALLRRGGTYRRDALLLVVGLALAAVVAIPQAITSVQTIDRARHLSSWSPRQLWDAMQLLCLLAPLWLAGVVAVATMGAWPARRDEPRWPREARLAVLVTLAAPMVLLVLVRGSQGASRDWDMHVPAASLVALSVAAALGLWWQRAGVGSRQSARSLSFALALASGTSMALWTLHADGRAQMARIDDQLRDRSAWSNEAWARAQDFMGLHALRAGQPERAIAHWQLAIEGAPNPRYFYQVALANMRLGRLDRSREWFSRTETRDPANADVWVGRSMVASTLDSIPAALAYADSALSRQPHKWDALEIRRKLLQFKGQ